MFEVSNWTKFERFYYSSEYPKVAKALEQLRNENLEEYRVARSAFLLKQLEWYEKVFGDLKKGYENLNTSLTAKQPLIRIIKKLEKEIAKSRAEIKLLSGKSKVKKNGITDSMVQAAREFPIDRLIEFNRTGKAPCPFHDEKTPSLHYYRDKNIAHCFGGCSKSYSSIDVFMQMYGVDFKDAVRGLNER